MAEITFDGVTKVFGDDIKAVDGSVTQHRRR